MRRPTEKQGKKGVVMNMLFEVRETVTRAVMAYGIFLVVYKFLLPMVIKILKFDFLVIIAILYILFLASFKILPVW